MNPTDNLERLIKEFQVTTSIETDKRILDDAFAALEESAREESPGLRESMRQLVVFPTVIKLAAVAAVAVVACTLFFKALSPKAIELGQVYQALQKAENVCVATYTGAYSEPVQQVWTSRTLKVVMYKSQTGAQAQFDLFDIPNRLKKTKYLPSGTVATEKLSAEAVIRAERSMRDVFELVPFANIDSAPKGSQWRALDKFEIPGLRPGEASVPGTKAYEMTWPAEKFFYKCRIFADAKSNLPKRTEYYFKEKPQDQYKFENMQVATYPTEKEIKLLIREVFGPDQDRSGEPGYIGTPEHQPQ